MLKNNSLSRIQNEVRILSTVHDSEFIVNLLGFFEDETYAYLVMEYIEGVDNLKARNRWPSFWTIRLN